jgi:hypothetical protein
VKKKNENLKCQWPHCTNEDTIMVSISLVQETDKGLEPIAGKAMPTPFCDYHRHLALEGLISVLQTKEGNLKLIAPPQIPVIESVVKAMVMSGLFDKIKLVKDMETGLINSMLK